MSCFVYCRVGLLSLAPTLLKVIWSPPATNGGSTLDSYIVQWDTTPTFASVSSRFGYVVYTNLTAPTPYFVNIPVTAGVAYYARVSAHNDRGYGTFAPSVPARSASCRKQLLAARTPVCVSKSVVLSSKIVLFASKLLNCALAPFSVLFLVCCAVWLAALPCLEAWRTSCCLSPVVTSWLSPGSRPAPH